MKNSFQTFTSLAAPQLHPVKALCASGQLPLPFPTATIPNLHSLRATDLPTLASYFMEITCIPLPSHTHTYPLVCIDSPTTLFPLTSEIMHTSYLVLIFLFGLLIHYTHLYRLALLALSPSPTFNFENLQNKS